MRKKGSHVGVVLSFVIFITFLIFIFAVAQPTLNQDDKKNLLSLIENKLIEKSSADLKSISVAIDKQSPQDCVRLNNFFSNVGTGENVVVTNDVVKIDQVSKSVNDLLILRGTDELFFKIQESEEFGVISSTPPSGSCQPLSEGNGYVLGLVKTNKQMFETKIIKLVNDYNTDYELLKNQLSVGPGDEFSFGFDYDNGTIIRTEAKNVSVSVYANEMHVQYINQNAELRSGFLSVRVW